MKNKQSQTWLFSFTDLAFLLLISLSLIPSAPNSITIHFAEMDVPVVPENQSMAEVSSVREAWELQVHAPSADQVSPYRLVRMAMVANEPKELESRVLSAEGLESELKALRGLGIRPSLLPEKSSLSQDFLYAVGTFAKVWGGQGNQAVVQPLKSEGQ